MSAWSAIRSRRGSTTISFVPRRLACLKNDDATGWLAVVLVPARIATSALIVSAQPTPQYGHTDSTWRSSSRGRIGMSLIGLFVSAPVGHAATHSPHVTHDDSPIGSFRSNAISVE